MKHCIFLLLFAFTLMGARAKTPRRGFMVEHGGASRTLGLAFDSRIGNYKNWGYKVGLARITTSSTDDFFSDEGRTNGWAVPAQMYYLVGGKRHSLELGLGLTIGLFESSTTENTTDRAAFTAVVWSQPSPNRSKPTNMGREAPSVGA